MEHRRPDPDELLARVREEEARRARGKLKVFFGAAPGVGKTYAMLEAARARKAERLDVVVGWVQTHGRRETEALLEGLEVMPRRSLSYRGTRLEEFDLEAALERAPALVLVDELAHTNAPGSRHARRYSDVQELLAAGIDVYTTLNVQHVESLNDVVAQITGVRVRETVPDAVLDAANEVELVDLPAEELRKRLAEGKVYIPEQAQRAAESFFREGNLIALRELALRRTAEGVDAQMQRYRREHAVRETWPTAERVLVCVAASPYAPRLVRAARRMASRLQAEWLAVYVETPAHASLAEADREQLDATLRLAEQLGAETVTLTGADVAEEVLAYARRRNVTKLVVGKPAAPRWRTLLRGAFVDRLVRAAGEIDVYVISGGAEEAAARPAPARPARRWRRYGFAALVVLACTALAAVAAERLAPTNLVMIYLVGVVVVALRAGRAPAALATVLGVAAFDFFFVPPRFTFAVADTQYLLTFFVMLAVALVISGLTARVRDQVVAARARERRTAALYALSRACASAGETYEVVRIAGQRLAEVFEAEIAVFLPHRDGRLAPAFAERAPFARDTRESSVAQWAFDHAERAGIGTSTLPGSVALYLPLVVSRGAVGVVGVRPGGDGRPFDPERVRLLEAFAAQIAVAVERTNLAAEAQAAQLQAESERIRSTLLASVSHDLRTPLAAIAGAASTLARGDDALPAASRRELVDSIGEQAERLNQFVANLLDMTRLEAGAIALNREWQPVEEVVGAALGKLEGRLRGREVRAEVPPTLPLVAIDTALVGQALANLIENALKYTPPSSPIEVVARLDGRELVLEVADRGPGIAAGEEQRVFEKFVRLPAGGSQPGAGLGLAICRAIAAAHGGTASAANRAGGGAVFALRLPLGGTPPEVPAEAPPVETRG